MNPIGLSSCSFFGKRPISLSFAKHGRMVSVMQTLASAVNYCTACLGIQFRNLLSNSSTPIPVMSGKCLIAFTIFLRIETYPLSFDNLIGTFRCGYGMRLCRPSIAPISHGFGLPLPCHPLATSCCPRTRLWPPLFGLVP